MQDNLARVILVVEDDPLLRIMTTEMIEDAGFLSIEAANADDAVALLEHRADIALLLTDVDMPGSMDGLKLAHAVRARWPPIKIVIVSGKTYLPDSELPLGSLFFQKPYSQSNMIDELRSMLASSPNSPRPSHRQRRE